MHKNGAPGNPVIGSSGSLALPISTKTPNQQLQTLANKHTKISPLESPHTTPPNTSQLNTLQGPEVKIKHQKPQKARHHTYKGRVPPNDSGWETP
ncbi:hypothetical protein E2C01_070552 [Portunus trituberculatus]|uniref:Uncharacterized protein n=1 Tax=Portunus trituberculatus TaxID=210409 RepID=A0A5B7I3S6_PORTR|nr:hypothetical protein [Portunus trituberculatus]